MASSYQSDPTDIPWGLVREEIKKIAPAQSTMVEYMLRDMDIRAPHLSEREQVQELLIAVMAALNPAFPRSQVRTPAAH